jgi:hypothetical protein
MTEVFLHNWPLTIFVPCVLVLLALLALVTRFMDRRDEHAAERSHQTG